MPAGRSDATSDRLQLNTDIELGQSMSGRDSHDDGQKSSYSNAVRNPHRWERPKQYVRSFERKNGRMEESVYMELFLVAESRGRHLPLGNYLLVVLCVLLVMKICTTMLKV